MITSEASAVTIEPMIVENVTAPTEVVVESQSVLEEPQISAPEAPEEVAEAAPEVLPEVPLEEIADVAPEVPREEVAVAAPEAPTEAVAIGVPAENAVVAAPAEEPAPRKKRGKAVEIDDQPMLF